MIENFPVRIDSTGRIVIPKEVRIKYNIDEATLLSIVVKDNTIVLEKVSDRSKNIITKLISIEKLYPSLKMRLYNGDRIIYQTNNIKTIDFIGDKCLSIVLENNNDYYLRLFIYFNNKSENILAELIIHLLS